MVTIASWEKGENPRNRAVVSKALLWHKMVLNSLQKHLERGELVKSQCFHKTPCFLTRPYSKARFSQKYAEFAYVKHISQNGFIMFPPFSIGKHCFFPFPVSCKWRMHEGLVLGIPKAKKVKTSPQDSKPLNFQVMIRVSNHLLSIIFSFHYDFSEGEPGSLAENQPKPQNPPFVMTKLTKMCIPKGCSLSRPGPGNKSLNGKFSLLNM